MKLTNLNEQNCESTASDCVIWSGKDIPCINLCAGDSVTKVVFALATELCTVMDQLDISNYDLKCLDTDPCGKPKDFKEFINLLITKVCVNG